MREVYVDDYVAPAFRGMLNDMLDDGHREYWLQGGRGSTKSTFISIAIITGMMMDRRANALVYRKVGNTLRDSVYGQFVKTIDMLGLNDYFRFRSSPLEIRRADTGQRIMFRGGDDPAKSKSIMVSYGYFRYLWFEELTEFNSMDDIKTIKASALRGWDGNMITFYSYNPPRSAKNWTNEESLRPTPGRFVHKSDYRMVPPEWLGQSFIAEAEALRDTNEVSYRHMYLGEVTGSGGQVFENVVTREITDEELKTLGYTYMGLDFGWYPDPTVWVHISYDAARQTVYIFDEYRVWKKPTYDLFAELKDVKGVTAANEIIADSADPKAINDLRVYGLNVTGAMKGAGTVNSSMKWLQSRRQIIIDPARCPVAAKEFLEYEYDRMRDGSVIDGYPDRDNHAIDAVRYALNRVWNIKGA